MGWWGRARVVNVGFGGVVVGEMWKRDRREEGPAERRRGDCGWKERVVIADCRA